jgi:hypothetical protein
VYFIGFGLAPAAVSPGVSLVAVCEITQQKNGFFAENLLAACLGPITSSFFI